MEVFVFLLIHAYTFWVYMEELATRIKIWALWPII